MEDKAGGAGGGDPGQLGIYDYQPLRDAIMADSPDALNGLVMIWKKIGWGVEGLGGDLRPIISSLRDAYSTSGSAPAFFAKLDSLQERIDRLGPDMHHNAGLMNQADLALRSAQKEITRLDGDGTKKLVDLSTGKDVRAAEAGQIAYALNSTYGDVKDGLIVPEEDDDRIRKPGSGSDGDTPDGTGGGYPGSTAGPATQSTGSSRVGGDTRTARPALGGKRPSPVGGLPGAPGSGESASRGADARGTSSTAVGSGSGSGRKIQVPGARAGGPLGGSRLPAARGGSLGAPGASGPPPGGTAPGQGGSGTPSTPVRPPTPPGTGPGTPGMVPPGGHGGAGGPGGRGGRRLTDYERIEDEFVDSRRANQAGGLIRGAHSRASTVDPGPGVLGSQKHKPAVETGHNPGPADTAPPTPQGFPDELKNGSFKQKDGTQYTVRRRGSGA